MALKNSLRLFQQAAQVMAGGVNSPVRSFRSVGGNPLVIQHGKGSQIFDVDGNAYTDYCLSWGSLILGHANKEVLSAVKKALTHGTSFGTTTSPEIEIAKFIVRHVPSIEMIRFVNSGTEAAMSAIRLARGFTKKNKVVKFDGCYHGHFDDLLTKAGSGVANLKESSSLGITKNHIENTISLPFNDTAALTEIFARHHSDIACCIIEPVAGNMGVVPAEKGFLQTLRDLTRRYNIVLIFDEIMTGFRSTLGGVQAEINIIPDMTCLGKIMGGGFPVGAYGGRKDLMACLAPLGEVYQAGTFSGNPVVMSAGLATLKNLNRSFYQRLNSLCENFAGRLNRYFLEHEIPASLSHYKSMMSLRFNTQTIRNYTEAQQASSEGKYAQLFQKLLRKGIYWPPAALEAFFISGAHTQKELESLSTQLTKFFEDT